MKYVIIGASAAGINAARTIRSLNSSDEVIIISKDEKVYSRCMLHFVIAGKRDIQGISFIDDNFFEENNIEWIKGVSVKSIDELNKTVTLDNLDEVSYDKLLIASGSSASIPPVKNLREANNVFCLRNIEDSLAIKQNSKLNEDVVVIGGGLVGIDAAVGLMAGGVKVHIVEMADRILPLQLDKKASENYEKLLKNHNVDVITGTSVKEVILNETGAASKVVLGNGKTIPCKFIVVAAGVRPNIDFIKNTSIKSDRGILVDDCNRTSSEDIFAAGDVTALAPIWPVAMKHGKNAAYNMIGIESHYNDNFAFQNSMNFLGLVTISIGIIEPPDENYNVYMFENKDVYKKVIVKDDIVCGAILQGDVAYCGVMTYIIKNKVDISKIKKDIFDINFADFYDIKKNGEYTYSA